MKKIINKFLLKAAEREIKDYTQKVSMGNRDQHGVILGHACLIFAQLAKKLPITQIVVDTDDDIYGKELSVLVLQTNNLMKEYIKDKDMLNSAGIKLWNETFRCLTHPELTNYGKEIWLYFSKASNGAEGYLNNLEVKFSEQKNNNMIEKIKEARKYLSMVPARYKV